MKQLLMVVFVAFVGVVLGAPPVHADVNDFSISSYDIRYVLSRDSEGRSTLQTTERIVAEFPNSDQNHGIERAIPATFDGHSTGLKIDSVTDGHGTLDYSTYESNGNTVLRIGDADTYVHGTQGYQITYTQRDVTKYFSNTDSDEFYWDTNGTEWRVPIEKLTVSLRVNDALAGALTDKTACYQGAAGADQSCTLERNGVVLSTSAQELDSGENITLAVGFVKGTFAAYKASLAEVLLVVWVTLLVVAGVIGTAVMIWVGVRWSRLNGRTKEIGTIVPEYIPPGSASVTASASVMSGMTAVFAAQLLDFAVRHYIKIYETEKKVLFTKSKDYEIEIIRDTSDLRDEEREILSDIFGGTVKVGDKLKLSSLRSNTAVYNRTLDNDKKLQKLVRGTYGLRERNAGQSAWFTRVAWVLLIFAVVNPLLLIFAIITFALSATLWPLSDKGLALYRYLEGLKTYIKVAEKERLRLLQSPEGAQKVGSVDPNNPAQLVKLYERVLPYAVLFGQEKEWNKQIGTLYESTGGQPDWYVSNAVFNAAVFSSAISSFSTSASYSAASSSGSGGSSGGGSSGGGGGGGGGGGW